MDDRDAVELAAALFASAVADEQVAHRLSSGDDAAALREEIRRLARARGARIRTAVMDDVLVVVLADAAIWHESTAVMRAKLTPSE